MDSAASRSAPAVAYSAPRLLLPTPKTRQHQLPCDLQKSGASFALAGANMSSTNGGLKRLTSVKQAAESTAAGAQTVYSHAKSAVPDKLKPTVNDVESKVAGAAAPFLGQQGTWGGVDLRVRVVAGGESGLSAMAAASEPRSTDAECTTCMQ